jgi:hypothetical protein
MKSPDFKQVEFRTLEPWKLNPKDIRTDDLNFLARKMKEVGVFRNFVTWCPGDDFPQKDNGRYIVGGGNMRWLALKEVWKCPPDMLFWISLNFPKTEEERIELSLLDNNPAGVYLEQPLAELLYPYRTTIDLSMYRFPFTNPTDLKTIVDGFGPDGHQDIEFVDKSDRHTISIVCKSDEEMIEMREYLGIEESKRNSIDASILRDILIKADETDGLDHHKNIENVIRYYLKFLPPKDSESIIDIGSGITTPYRGVLSNRTKDYTSLDIRKSSRVDYIADIRSVPMKDKSYQWGWCVELLEHLSTKDQEMAMSEMIRICENLIIAFPTPEHENFSDDPSHQKVEIDFLKYKNDFNIEDHTTKSGRAIFVLKESRRENIGKKRKATASSRSD